MTRHIWILYTDFERQYQESIRYLREKWFPDETRLKPCPPGAEQDIIVNAPQQSQQNSTPNGKRVI